MEADPKGSVSCILYGDDELSEGSDRVPLRFIPGSIGLLLRSITQYMKLDSAGSGYIGS